MPGAGLPALDLLSLLQFVLTALAVLVGALVLLKKAASRYFYVDAAFEAGEGEDYESRHRMSIGGDDGGGKASAGGPVTGSCAVCQRPATKKCSRCKSVWYCSQACQTKHWENHKLNCKLPRLSNKLDIVTYNDEESRRKKSSGFSSISLVPTRGICKVLQVPKKILFPYDEFVKLFNWDKPGFPPCGLQNCGNSCFANVVLQCLACTRPLIAYLLERDHRRGCIRKRDDWCFLCELQVHIQRASESLHPFSPINILSRLPNIGGNLGYGRQEDAHEFMRFAIDTMQSICLDEFGGEKALDPSTQETTLIHYIFGGHLQSQVICTKCNMISNRYENMMDLTVEIQGDAESLEECLDQFTMKEWLDGENMYKCDGCNDYVRAWKRLTVHRAPNILTIALKRFQSGRFGKLNKRVTFPENLDLTPYMSGNGDGTDLYTLYAVVVHVDMLNASFFGHYICYTKDYHGRWYRIDDCKVVNVEVEEVLAQGAYMLLYSRRNALREPYMKPNETARKKHFVADPESMVTKPIIVDCLPSNAGSESSLPSCDLPIGVSLPGHASNAGSESSLPSCDLPIGVSLPGHERDISIKRYTSKETELGGMGLDTPVDVEMDDIEPSSMGHKDHEEGKSSISGALEDISSVDPMRSNSIPSVENSPIEVQATEVKPIFAPKDLGYMDIDHAESSSLEPKELEEGKSSISPRVPAEFSSIGVRAVEVHPAPVPKDSVDIDLDDTVPSSSGPSDLQEANSRISPHGPDDISFVDPMKSNSIYPVEILSGGNSVSSDADICMEENTGSTSVREESVRANGIKRLDVVASASEGTRTSSFWENGPRGKPKPLFSRGFLDRPSRKESTRLKGGIQRGNCGVAFSSEINCCSNGHVEPDFLGQSVRENAASLESLPSNGYVSAELEFQSVRADEASTESLSANGQYTYKKFKNEYKIAKKMVDTDASLELLSANGKDILPESGVPSLKKNGERIEKKENGFAERAPVYRADGKNCRPGIESNGKGRPGTAFASENGSLVYKNGVASTSGFEVGSAAGSIHLSKTVPGVCPSDRQQQI